MQLQGKRIAILAEDLYEDLELWYPALRFREAGAEVTLVGSGKDTYTSKHGYPVQADTRAEDVQKVVAAICHAAWMLVSADVVRGKRLTCFASVKDDVINAGGCYEDQEVVRDGTLITSRTPADLPAFCSTILEALAEAPVLSSAR
jgi:deglycase